MKRILFKKIATVAAILVSLSVVSICNAGEPDGGSATITISDNFNDNAKNNTLWTQTAYGNSPYVPTINEVNSRVEVFIPAGARNSTTENSFGSYYYLNTNSPLNGDFDATVDFNLLTYSYGNGVSSGIYIRDANLARENSPNGTENYVFTWWDSFRRPHLVYVPTSDIQGSLRLKRTNSTSGQPIVTGYYKDVNGGWIQIGSATFTTLFPTGLAIQSRSQDNMFGHMDSKVTFDNANLIIFP